LCPSEEGWSNVNALWRAKAARPGERLEQAMAEAIAAMTAADARGWFTPAGYCASFN